jgi:hypothetical protein
VYYTLIEYIPTSRLLGVNVIYKNVASVYTGVTHAGNDANYSTDTKGVSVHPRQVVACSIETIILEPAVTDLVVKSLGKYMLLLPQLLGTVNSEGIGAYPVISA